MNGSVADRTAGVCGARTVPGSQCVLTLTERVVRRSRLAAFKVGRVCPQRAVACRKSRAVASSRRAEYTYPDICHFREDFGDTRAGVFTTRKRQRTARTPRRFAKE